MKAADVGAQVAVVVPKSGGRYNAVMAKALEAVRATPGHQRMLHHELCTG